MKRYGKRLLSLLLALTLGVNMAVTAWASAADEEATYHDGVELSGSLGDMLAAELENGTETASQGSIYSVTNLTVDGSAATVTYQTDETANIVVALYDETTGRMLLTAMAEADSAANTVTVQIAGDMPEYFVAKAFLLDQETSGPLSEAYTTRLYTQEMQEFLDASVNGFDASLVLNLDDDATTNFGVYCEDTTAVKNTGAVITDNTDGTYTVTNADETFTELKKGDKLVYTDGNDTLWLIKVSEISVEGNTVTVTQDSDADLSDFFDYLKIETDSFSTEPIIDDSTLSSGVVRVEDTSEVGLLSAAVDGDELSYSNSIKFKLIDGKVGSTSIKGSVNLTIGFTAKLNYYLTPSYQDISFKFESKYTLKGSVKGSLSEEIALSKIKIPLISGIYVGATPSVNVEFSGEVSLSTSLKSTAGFGYNSNDGFKNLASGPSFEGKTELEGKFFVGFKPAISLSVIDEKVAKAEVKGSIGFEATAKAAPENEPDGETKHQCQICFEGNIYIKGSVTVSIELAKGLKGVEGTLMELKSKVGDFYYSGDYAEFGWGECPHMQYRVSVLVVDDSGKPLARAHIEGLGGETLTADENGRAKGYAGNGNYTLTAFNSKYSGSKTVTVKDKPVSETITAKRVTNSVTVTVTDGDGRPLPGMTISGTGLDTDPVTDQSGVSRFKLDNGSYTLTASDGTYAGTKTLTLRGQAVKLTIVASKDFQNLTVTVVDEEGKALPDMVIGGTGLDPAPVTDANGVARFTVKSNNYYDLTASGGGYEGSRRVAVSSQSVSVDIVARKQEACAVTVAVTDYKTYEPVKNALVQITKQGDKKVYEATADENGKFTVLISAGDYTLQVSHEGYQTYEMTFTAKPDKEMIIKVDLKAEKMATLTGTVTNESGTAISGASITVTQDGKTVGQASSNSEGAFSLQVPAGTYAVTASASGYVVQTETMAIDEGKAVQKNFVLEQEHIDCTFDRETGTLTIFGKGPIKDYKTPSSYVTNPPWNSIRNDIKSVIIEDGVTAIGDYAFYDCRYMTSITFPDSVTRIGNSAFSSCSSLSSVTIPGNVTHIGFAAFFNSGLKSIKLLDGIISIGNSAFASCYSLSDVQIANSVETIGGRAFEKCLSLASVTIPASVTNIGNDAFSGCTALTSVIIPGSVTDIEQAPFFNCTSLTSAGPFGSGCSIEFGWKTEIPASVFYNCTGLTSVTIPDSVTSIGSGAFRSCSGLTSVTIPDSVTNIGSSAFRNCSGLTSVTIPDSVTSIGDSAFSGCSGLTRIYYKGTQEQWNMIYKGPLPANATVHFGGTDICSKS